MNDGSTTPGAPPELAGTIQPSVLVKADAAPVAPRWPQVTPGLALGLVIGVSLLIAVPLRRHIQRSRMDPRELAFIRMARRLRLTRTERATLRQLAVALPGVEAEAKISPAALLLSERAFLKGAAQWIGERDARERTDRVVTLQRKVFAPNRRT